MKLKLFLISLLFLLTTTATAKQYTIVIDAGHGGHDTGAMGAFSKEKDINLKVALAFGKYINQYLPNIKVIYTRRTDVFIPLIDRANIANKNRADIFISIHTNALPNGKIARGIETYTMGLRRSNEKFSAALRENEVITYEKNYQEKYNGYDPKSPESLIMFELMHDSNMEESVALASSIQKNICSESGRANKGVKQDVFLVLRETSMPACLVELGFISTPDEEKYLNTAEAIDQLARGIYKGFAKYIKQGNTNIKPLLNTKETTDKPKPTEASKPAEKSKPTEASKPAEKPKPTEESKPVDKPKTAEASKPVDKPKTADNSKTIYKVQILATDKVLKANDPLLKGHSEATYYKDRGMVKYTIGESENRSEMLTLRKQLLTDFPEAFIVSFKNGERVY